MRGLAQVACLARAKDKTWLTISRITDWPLEESDNLEVYMPMALAFDFLGMQIL